MPQQIDIGDEIIEFPDDMSDADINAAIRLHTGWKPPEKAPNSFVGARGSPVARQDKSYSDLTLDAVGGIAKGFNTGLGTITKGVPVIGNLVDSSPVGPQVQEFEKNHPIASTGLKIAGTTAAVAPIMAAAAPALGTGFAANALGGTGIMSGLNIADTVSRKGSDTTKEDVLWDIGMGTLGGVGGAGLGKLISPRAIPIPELPHPPVLSPKPPPISDDVLRELQKQMSPEELAKIQTNVAKGNYTGTAKTKEMLIDAANKGKLEKHAAEVAKIKEAHKAEIDSLAPSEMFKQGAYGAAGTAVGHMLAGPMGGVVGAMISPYLRQAAPNVAENYVKNQLMASPTARAILMSVMGEMSNGAAGIER